MSARLSEQRVDAFVSTKIEARHHDRIAIVYVRQSTTHQLLHHQESTKLQYNLTERAKALGWPSDRIVVIDDDLGRSGANAEGRPGFQRLVAEVGLDHVGIILGIEMSRLARSCRDFHQLLEVCALFSTLISDLDGVYDPSTYNDRLLLGLKGTMSEAELHLIKQRMLMGKLNKAKRGELGMQVPVGYVRRPSGEIVKDPDEQAQDVVRTIFEQFEARGTLHGVLCYLVQHDIRLPIRERTGVDKGELRWHRPNRPTIQNLLWNPIYAGAYVYGRRSIDPRSKKPGRPSTGRKVARMGEWAVCLRDKLPAYITWEQYEANRAQLASNAAASRGVVRTGDALLTGIVVCGRCGLRMAAQYGSGLLRYSCVQASTMYGARICQTLAARGVDREVESLVLRALEPAALEVSLAVSANIEAERARLQEHWQQRLERGQYEVDRAQRQYNAVEPENRLVARTLERQLEAHLVEQQKLQEEYARYRAQRPATLTDDERAQIRRLAANVPTLWSATTTTSAQKKTIVRQLIDRVIVTVEGKTERVTMKIEWAGGHMTESSLIRPVAKLEQLSYYDALLAFVLKRHEAGATWAEIADQLNSEKKWRPAKRRETFNAEMVGNLLKRTRSENLRTNVAKVRVRKHEWTMRALADELKMPYITLNSWRSRGWLKARKIASHSAAGQWIAWADARELERLRALRVAPKHKWSRAKLA